MSQSVDKVLVTDDALAGTGVVGAAEELAGVKAAAAGWRAVPGAVIFFLFLL